jgi:hypothetical protein
VQQEPRPGRADESTRPPAAKAPPQRKTADPTQPSPAIAPGAEMADMRAATWTTDSAISRPESAIRRWDGASVRLRSVVDAGYRFAIRIGLVMRVNLGYQAGYRRRATRPGAVSRWRVCGCSRSPTLCPVSAYVWRPGWPGCRPWPGVAWPRGTRPVPARAPRPVEAPAGNSRASLARAGPGVRPVRLRCRRAGLS